MILNKAVTNPQTGVVANCWVLTSVLYHALEGTTDVSFSGYVNHATYVAKQAPVYSISFTIPANSNAQLGGAVVAFVKAAALQHPDLHGATEAPGQ